MAWEDGLRVVKVKGEAMQRESEKKPSAMASIVGLDDNQLGELIEEVLHHTGGNLKIANFLSERNHTMAGDMESIERALIVAKSNKFKAKLVKRLPVSGAFHTEYMAPATESLSEILAKMSIHQPKIPIISNVDAKPHTNVESLKKYMEKQIVSPVLWEQTMEGFILEGIREFIEVGVGTVLADLTMRIAKRMNIKVEVSNISS